ncbi:uncharacterized protein ACR2FA_003026 [Aphomia sociella]
MNQNCLICDAQTGSSLKNYISIFGENNGLQSGKKLPDILKEIIEKPIRENYVHSNSICKKCYKFCTEYDSIQVR